MHKRREQPRLKMPEDMFILLKSTNTLAMGEIVNLSQGGVAIKSIALRKNETIKMDLVCLRKKFKLENVMAKIVAVNTGSNQSIKNDDNPSEVANASMRFENLNFSQREQLNDFLRYCMAENV